MLLSLLFMFQDQKIVMNRVRIAFFFWVLLIQQHKQIQLTMFSLKYNFIILNYRYVFKYESYHFMLIIH